MNGNVIEETLGWERNKRGGSAEQECHEKPVSSVITISPLGSIICLIGIPRVLLCLLGIPYTPCTPRLASPLVSSFPLPPVFPRTISLDATRIKELTFVQVYIGTYARCLEIREYEVRVCVYSGTRWYERENIGKY